MSSNDHLGATSDHVALPNDGPLISSMLTRLVTEEDLRLKPYHDYRGKLTIGIGRNLDDVGISRDEAGYLCENDIIKAIELLDRALAWWRTLSFNRQLVLLDMTFNMGIGTSNPPTGLLGFKNMITALLASEWVGASKAMLDSEWAKQVGQRAVDLAQLMLRG